MKKQITFSFRQAVKSLEKAVLATAVFVSTSPAFSQAAKGVGALNAASQDLTQYYDAGTKLAYGAAAVIGLIGGVKVYQKWSGGDPDTGKVAGAWFGGAIFLATATTVLRAVFL